MMPRPGIRVLCASVFLQGCLPVSPLITGKCKDGNPYFVPKRCSDEYEIYVRERGKLVSLALGDLSTLKGPSLGIGPDERIVRLAQEMDQGNIRLRTLATRACEIARKRPCAPESRLSFDELWREYDALGEKARRLRTEMREMLGRQIQLAEGIAETAQRRYLVGLKDIGGVLSAYERLLELRLAASAGREERTQALERSLVDARRLLDIARVFVEQGRVIKGDAQEAEFHIRDIELRLHKEKATESYGQEEL